MVQPTTQPTSQAIVHGSTPSPRPIVHTRVTIIVERYMRAAKCQESLANAPSYREATDAYRPTPPDVKMEA